MQTIVTLLDFEVRARKLLTAQEYEAMLQTLANNPTTGALIQGTGGLRKIRLRRHDRKKIGGSRVIYYYHSKNKPIFLLDIYAKAKQEDLTQSQHKRLATLANTLKKTLDEFS